MVLVYWLSNSINSFWLCCAGSRISRSLDISARETLDCYSKFIFPSILHIPCVVSVIVDVENPKSGLKNLGLGCSNVLMCHSHKKDTLRCGLLSVAVVNVM